MITANPTNMITANPMSKYVIIPLCAYRAKKTAQQMIMKMLIFTALNKPVITCLYHALPSVSLNTLILVPLKNQYKTQHLKCSYHG